MLPIVRRLRSIRLAALDDLGLARSWRQRRPCLSRAARRRSTHLRLAHRWARALLISPSRIDGGKILRNTWPFNAAGTPAISIPLSNTNLPVGLHVVARRGDDDDKLLRAARLITDVVS